MNRIAKSFSTLSGLVAFCWALNGPLVAEMVEYTAGHADIGLVLEGPEQLFLHYHFGVGSAILDGLPATALNEELAPSEAYVRVSDATIVFPGAVDFLGTASGDPIWVLPQGNTPGVPFFGFATAELNPMQFTSAGFRLSGMSGPAGGNFALFQQPSFGPPNVFMRTNDGINPLVDFLPSTVGGHDHYNFAFTKVGIYDLEIEGFATTGAGMTLTDSGSFRFLVGSATAIPEPGSLALLAVCGCFVALRSRPQSS
jgi:surface-anchored protein